MEEESTLCQVCKVDGKPPKYKCPACTIRFCSLECFKKHKNEGDGEFSEYHCDQFKLKLAAASTQAAKKDTDEELKQ
jgi:hypothetical protein